MNDGRSIQQRAEAQALAAELTKYGVTIMPTHRKCEPAAVDGVDERDVDLLRTGSGICIHVGGRYFIATAAHVINSVPYDEHFVSTPTTRNWPLLIVDGGHRGEVSTAIRLMLDGWSWGPRPPLRQSERFSTFREFERTARGTRILSCVVHRCRTGSAHPESMVVHRPSTTWLPAFQRAAFERRTSSLSHCIQIECFSIGQNA
jgi:hypothetical protein